MCEGSVDMSCGGMVWDGMGRLVSTYECDRRAGSSLPNALKKRDEVATLQPTHTLVSDSRCYPATN